MVCVLLGSEAFVLYKRTPNTGIDDLKGRCYEQQLTSHDLEVSIHMLQTCSASWSSNHGYKLLKINAGHSSP